MAKELLKLVDESKQSDTGELSKNSEKWANIIKPFAIFIFSLLSVVIIAPFLGMIFIKNVEIVKNIIEWSKMVLAPVTGFAGSVTTFYFATRNS